jgi:chromate transporter
MRGLPGALATLIAASLPCSLAAVLVTILYQSWIQKPLFAIAMHGAAAAGIGIMFATGWTILHPFRKTVPTAHFVLLSAGACALAVRGLSPLSILLLAALIGCAFPGKRNAQ